MKNVIFIYLSVLIIVISPVLSRAQKTFPVDGIKDRRPGYYAFQHANLTIAPGQELEDATLIIKAGKVEYAGPAKATPDGAVEVNTGGRYIYPSFIDLDSDYGLKRAKFDPKKPLPGPKGWNQAIKTSFDAAEHIMPDTGTQKKYLQAGFGAVLTHRHDGISRGSGALVLLGNLPTVELFVKQRASHHLSFKKGNSKQKYPGSLMGVIALMRQTYYDGKWYKRYGHLEETNESLEAWNALQSLPQILETDHFLDIFRGDRLAKEFNVSYIYRGSGEEYRRSEEIAQIAHKIILPINYPKPMDLRHPLKALYPTYAEMKHWEWAPFNAGVLDQAGVELALTMRGLKSPKDFHKALVKTVSHRWTEAAALKALTVHPAKWLGVYDQIGTLEKGKWANFIITDGSPFHTKTKILENWIKGRKHTITTVPTSGLAGQYDLNWGNHHSKIIVKNNIPNLLLNATDTVKSPLKLERVGKLLQLSFQNSAKGIVRLEGRITREGSWEGTGVDPKGNHFIWNAIADTSLPVIPKSDPPKIESSLPPLSKPFTAYGWMKMPEKNNYLIQHATVWTNTSKGIMRDADVLIINGKIAQVGSGLTTPSKETTVVDGTGMHLTTGIIDEHSHIAITRGVNECTQAVTAEVRIGDVINAEDVNIYRQLAGGVTTSQLLHGSCNPIGGQSAIIKLRWGKLPEELKVEDADPFIKFALGENVKRSYSANNKRYPTTRMGVAQIYEDAFTAAEEYARNKLKNPAKTRVDLEMETIAQILHSKRFVTCHSYVQSEINMLMHTAVKHGFHINTFTHGLEAYKVADKIKAHGAGVSTFSDWWAYKYEVKDAIPYNPAILVKMGVVTAINSDDAEMGRRLNQEAAKGVKYGGLSEEEAWKMVTLNPAKLLHLDHRLGTVEVGKDADLVLWNEDPLSVYALPQATWVDGVKYYDIHTEKEMRAQMEKERNRIAQKMLAEAEKTGKTQAPKALKNHLYHCEDSEDEGNVQ